MTSRDIFSDINARLVIAHRGNRAHAPENTLLALRQAVDLGVDALEFDVRLSRDGVAVLMHDATIDRTRIGSGRVSAYTFAELAAFDARDREAAAERELARVPSLEQALDAFRRIPLVIEVKELAAAEPTARLVHAFGLEGRVLVGSAENDVMQWFYRSGLRCCASMHDASRWIPAALLGRTPSPPPFQVLSITPRFRGLPIPVLRLARTAQRVGVPTHVWTVNDPCVAQRYWRGGVSGIVTDDPGVILRARDQ